MIREPANLDLQDIRVLARFAGKEPEKVLLVLRRHWIVLVGNVVFFSFIALLPLFFWLLLPETLAAMIRGTAWLGMITIFAAAYYLFVWLFFFTALLDYYLDVWVLTERRIIDVQQYSLFKRVIAEQRIIRVQDVTSEVRGILPTFLGYGNVFIQTAGQQERFIFRQVPNPEVVKARILEVYNAAIREHPEYYEEVKKGIVI